MHDWYGHAPELRTFLTSSVLVEALDYWERLAAGRVAPARSAIDPMAIPRLLPATYIVAAARDGAFRYHLAGTAIEDAYRLGPLKDRTPEELLGARADNVLVPYRRVRDEAVLFYREADLEWVSAYRKYVTYKVLLMPLSEDGERIDMILGVHDFVPARPPPSTG